MRAAVPAASVQFALTAAAFLALMHAFVVSDFSVRLVALNSHSAKPLIYKVAGTWGNHEGSMLLWMLILTLFGAMVALWGGNLPPSLKARVLGVQATIGLDSVIARVPAGVRLGENRLGQGSVLPPHPGRPAVVGVHARAGENLRLG